MTSRRVQEIIALYRAYFREHNVDKLILPGDEINDSGAAEHARLITLGHCYKMLDHIEILVEHSWPARREEAIRLLSFVQGCLWSLGIFCQDEIEHHNRVR